MKKTKQATAAPVPQTMSEKIEAAVTQTAIESAVKAISAKVWDARNAALIEAHATLLGMGVEIEFRDLDQQVTQHAIDTIKRVTREVSAQSADADAEAPAAPVKAPARRNAKSKRAANCAVKNCKRPYRSQGYCAAHYQAARKYDWPMPGKAGFSPPPRKRGRPAK